MKKCLIFFLLLVPSLHLQAQSIAFDIFGNLQYEAGRQQYKASLTKDIFYNLIFSDNNKNEITFEHKYLALQHHEVLTDKDARTDFFSSLIQQYRVNSGYKATFSVDILNKIIIADNRNNKIERSIDIFGNPNYEANTNGSTISIERDLNGNLEYKASKEQASLRKDIFDKWSYSDSSGNKFEFSDRTWSMLQQVHRSEENIFYFLISGFLHF